MTKTNTECKGPKDTALRDILSLEESGVLIPNPDGGSTSYSVARAFTHDQWRSEYTFA
jgi:hypothetical protein